MVAQDETTFHSTGQTSRVAAKAYVDKLIEKRKSQRNVIPEHMTFRQYADQFFKEDSCPHVRRLREEEKSITKRHIYNQRLWHKNYVFTDELAELPFTEIKRAHLLDFRSRLRKKIDGKLNTVNKVMAVIKTIYKEAFFREDIDRDPTQGIGNIREHRKEPGIFTTEEIQQLFPSKPVGPWRDIRDYTCFLVAFTTGMRRGEILALRWKHADWENSKLSVVEAWKSRTETGEPK